MILVLDKKAWTKQNKIDIEANLSQIYNNNNNNNNTNNNNNNNNIVIRYLSFQFLRA